jgi:hypothetical protein
MGVDGCGVGGGVHSSREGGICLPRFFCVSDVFIEYIERKMSC